MNNENGQFALEKHRGDQVGLSGIVTKISHDLPPELLSLIRENVTALAPSLHMGDFKLRLVIDTNVLFQCVRGRVLEGSCFLDKIGRSPLLELCAPPELEKEIYEKIEVKFPKDKKTRNVDIDHSKQVAKELLQLIHIERNIDAEYMDIANGIMNDRDKDDAPFLGLYISVGADGILTRDKDLKDQEGVRAFELKDAGRVLTAVNCGTLSLFATCHSLPAIVKVWTGILGVVLDVFFEFAAEAGHACAMGVHKGFEAVRDWPSLGQFLALVGIVTVECRTGIISKSIETALSAVVAAIKVLIEILRGLSSLAEAVLPYFKEMLIYTGDALKEIENLRPA